MKSRGKLSLIDIEPTNRDQVWGIARWQTKLGFGDSICMSIANR